MKKFVQFVLLGLHLSWLFSCTHFHAQEDYEVFAPYFSRLDSVLQKKDEYRKLGDARLENLKNQLSPNTSPADCYLLYRLIARDYLTYDSDSAIAYFDKCLEVAGLLKNKAREADAHVGKANTYTAIGLLDRAGEELQKARSLPMNQETLLEYYVQQIYFITHQNDYAGTTETNKLPYLQYTDSILLIDSDTLSPYYLWARYWQAQGRQDTLSYPRVRQMLKGKISKMSLGDPWYSRLAFAVWALHSKTFMELAKADQIESVDYAVRSICSDIQRVNWDIPSLFGLAARASSLGDWVNANKMMRASMDIQAQLPDRSKAISYNAVLLNVASATEKQLGANLHERSVLNTILALFAALLLVLLAVIYVLFRKERLLKGQLATQNEQLARKASALGTQREHLSLSNEEYQHQIDVLRERINEQADVLNARVAYLNELLIDRGEDGDKWEVARKDMKRKLTLRKYDELLDMLCADEKLSKKEHEQFLARFDRAFLKMYPSFMERLNACLKPEAQVTLKQDDGLSTDLRICALIRLGVENSVEIAKVLRVSPQTVYNARLKLRANTREGESLISFLTSH